MTIKGLVRQLSTSREIVRASIWTVLGNVTSRSFGALSALALSVMLGAFGYGQYSLILSTVTLCAGIGQLGLQSVLTRDLAKERSDRRAACSSTALLLISIVTIATAIMMIAATSFLGFLQPLRDAAAGAIWLLVPWAVAIALNNQVTASLVGVYRFRASAGLAATRGFLVGGLLVALALRGSIPEMVLGSLIGESAAAAIALTLLARGKLLTRNWDRRYLRRLVRVGAGAGAASLLIQSVAWGAQTLLANQPDGLVQVGVVALGMRLGLVAGLLSNSLVTVLLPYLSANRGTASTRSAVLWPILVAAASSALMALVLPLIRWYWPSVYAEHTDVLILMMVLAVCSAANTSVGSLAVARGLFRAWVLSDVLLSAVMATLVVLLVPSAGALGLAISQIAAYASSAVFLAWCSRGGTQSS